MAASAKEKLDRVLAVLRNPAAQMEADPSPLWQSKANNVVNGLQLLQMIDVQELIGSEKIPRVIRAWDSAKFIASKEKADPGDKKTFLAFLAEILKEIEK